jgi:hypothetical protein
MNTLYPFLPFFHTQKGSDTLYPFLPLPPYRGAKGQKGEKVGCRQRQGRRGVIPQYSGQLRARREAL